jgi:HSP20 family protein
MNKEVTFMNLVRWEPFKELSSIRGQMDRLLESFFKRGETMDGLWTPSIDFSETTDEFVIKADIPGLEEKDLSVTLSGNNLLIKGERKEEKEDKGKHYHKVERSYGSFQRSIPLPDVVDADRISADYQNGVLEVHLPKTASAKPKEIKISTK